MASELKAAFDELKAEQAKLVVSMDHAGTVLTDIRAKLADMADAPTPEAVRQVIADLDAHRVALDEKAQTEAAVEPEA